MAFVHVGAVQSLAGGVWTRRPVDPDAVTRGVSIDSRTCEPGDVFVALAGERHDAHAFLEELCGRGGLSPAAVIVERDGGVPPGYSGGVVKVSDTRAALGRLARGWRRSLDSLRVVAVTGSNGKTGTVRMIDAVLGGGGGGLRGTRAVKSFNNDVGVPLTVLGARRGDQYLVCEVGMNAPGEILPLAEVCEPDVAVITTVGRAHVGAFTDGEAGVAREKASLLAGLREWGTGVVNGECPLLEPYLGPVARLVTFGAGADADVRLLAHETVVGQGGPRVRFRVQGSSVAWFEVAGMGRHTAMNACAAVAVGRRFGLRDDAIARGLASCEPPAMRLSTSVVGARDGWRGVLLISDCYNASPESTAAALGVLDEVRGDRRPVLVLGDMLELGDASEAAHAEVIEAAAGMAREGLLITVGPAMSAAASRHGGVTAAHACDGLDAGSIEAVCGLVGDGDAVLLKGSRAMGLERVGDALRGRFESADAAGGLRLVP